MRFHLSELCLGAMSASLVAGTAWAGPALDEEQKAPAEGVNTDPSAPTVIETPVEYGFGLRIRNVRVPKGMLELFVDRAAGGVSSVGIGAELIRRRGTVELVLGLEFEHLHPGEGVWINRDENVAAGAEADFILSPEHSPDGDELGWFTIDFTFVNHAEINKYVSVRYGGGAGIGILTGGLHRYDVVCVGATNSNPEPGCRPSFGGFQGNALPGGNNPGTPVEYDLPPVFPVVNAILGVQIKPIPKMVINIEGGIRTAPFFGMTIGYFL